MRTRTWNEWAALAQQDYGDGPGGQAYDESLLQDLEARGYSRARAQQLLDEERARERPAADR